VSQAYDTQDRKPVVRSGGRAYVWRCGRCGRFLARIERLDGELEVYHKCGAMNRLAGVIDGCCLVGEAAHQQRRA
jgi:hypothetical protein